MALGLAQSPRQTFPVRNPHSAVIPIPNWTLPPASASQDLHQAVAINIPEATYGNDAASASQIAIPLDQNAPATNDRGSFSSNLAPDVSTTAESNRPPGYETTSPENTTSTRATSSAAPAHQRTAGATVLFINTEECGTPEYQQAIQAFVHFGDGETGGLEEPPTDVDNGSTTQDEPEAAVEGEHGLEVAAILLTTLQLDIGDIPSEGLRDYTNHLGPLDRVAHGGYCEIFKTWVESEQRVVSVFLNLNA